MAPPLSATLSHEGELFPQVQQTGRLSRICVITPTDFKSKSSVMNTILYAYTTQSAIVRILGDKK